MPSRIFNFLTFRDNRLADASQYIHDSVSYFIEMILNKLGFDTDSLLGYTLKNTFENMQLTSITQYFGKGGCEPLVGLIIESFQETPKKITGEPTYANLQELRATLKNNATSVDTIHRGGGHQHLGLVLPTHIYNVMFYQKCQKKLYHLTFLTSCIFRRLPRFLANSLMLTYPP